MNKPPFGVMDLDKDAIILQYTPAKEGADLESVLGRNLFNLALSLGLENSLDDPFDYEKFVREGVSQVFMLRDGITLTLLRLPDGAIALWNRVKIASGKDDDESDYECERCDKLLTVKEFTEGELCSKCKEAESPPPKPPPGKWERKRQHRSKSVREIEEQLNELELTVSIVNGRPVVKSKAKNTEPAIAEPEKKQEIKQGYNHDLIKQALILSKGSVTKAARMLGVSHQRLIYIIEHPCKDLMALRKPVKPRRKSIITKPQSAKRGGQA